MDILIPDIWLRDYLKTKATPKQIAEYLSLCGPSVEKITETTFGPVYSIEVTTNRVDSASVFGIAREASAILPRFGFKTTLHSIKLPNYHFRNKVDYLRAIVDHSLCPRFTAVLIRNVSIGESPSWVKDRLSASQVRPINNIVDISNFIMLETGQPTHTFDYDKIENHKMVLRESKKGEKLVTLDGKTHSLPGGDIVIEDGKGRLIDLAGIMGGENSAVGANTKNVLFFVQTYNPVNIRKTSMSLAHRTDAAVLFEKGLDPELVSVGILRGIELFETVTYGKAEKEILDLYPELYKAKKVFCDLDFIKERLGVSVSKNEIGKTLKPLGFETFWKRKILEVTVPSFRANDIQIPEDVVEEVARIYGYHNLPSELPQGKIPDSLPDASFNFEKKIKDLLSGWGGIEVYTLSLVSENMVKGPSLKLRNPLGKDTEYLRTSLMPSLIKAASENKGLYEAFHLFEMANVYLPKKGDLPEEKLYISGIFSNYSYREAKGVVEVLLSSVHINTDYIPEDSYGFALSQRTVVRKGSRPLGQFGILENGLFYYEFAVENLREEAREFSSYSPIPKFPPQIEDLTLILPAKTRLGEVIHSIKSVSPLIDRVELRDTYENSYTFRIWYQHPTKTLTDVEVETVRNKILKLLAGKFGSKLKN